ncbi:hypothetical protein [Nocardia implantans]|uniref:Uncharacterized protein n=1 Tax=Nocardia implantans TaxID=3108168 RepID=A0ABU6AVI0_9NOCA|nr:MULTISPECIES: hypothetical protein [unclassified Nocardia]MBF6193176.1 hypothetical protein [Nocardia beijingensis]MEA3527226.1 hypothetical protein [Nocardia sp. CDC192]MEB3511450.1 hypothetical protein [Nocardia sp. CDC186]
MRDPFGVWGAKKTRPTVAAPPIRTARISPQAPPSGSGVADSEVWTYTAFFGAG